MPGFVHNALLWLANVIPPEALAAIHRHLGG
jgi:hypothetical protein